MSVVVVRLSGLAAEALDKRLRIPCDAAVFRDDYAVCSNVAIKRRGKWQLCAPHARKDELEVVDNDDHMR